jgi:glycosyltransferase involved in cell wall biosynthesis
MTATSDDRIQVWYLIGTLAVGGTERTLVDLVNGLDRKRFAPTVWTIAEPGPLADEIDEDIPVRSLDATNKLDPRPPLRLARALRRERPSILQAFLYFDNVLARLVGQVSPETTVITGVREVPDSMSLHRDLVDRATLGFSDHIISNSEAGAEWIIDRGVNSNEVSVVWNGRDVEAYNVPEPEGLRAELNVGEGPVVGTVGRLVERKGHHDLLEAWPSVLDKFPGAELVFVGDGPERESLRRHASELGVESSVHLLGRRDDVPALLALFDLFAFPSHYEGLPGALLEAMCAGLPIVTTPVDGCAELIEDGENGVHVPVQEPEGLAAAIVALLSNSKRAGKLGSAAAQRAHSEFTIRSMTESFQSLYERLETGRV